MHHSIDEGQACTDRTVFLEWTFAPENYFDGTVAYAFDEALVSIELGKVTARLPITALSSDNSFRERLEMDVRSRFEAVQVLTHQRFELSKARRLDIDSAGKKHYFLEAEAGVITITGGQVDFAVTNAAGNTVRDSRRERADRKNEFSAQAASLVATDLLAAKLLKFYGAAVNDPQNEMIHLYAIRDALFTKFGNEKTTRSTLAISAHDWSTLGRLANDSPLLQGRHQGRKYGGLRKATAEELRQARTVAREMIEAYLRHAASRMP